MTHVLELDRDDDLVRGLLAPYARVQPVTLRRRPTRRWKRRVALVTVCLGLTGAIASLAIAGTGWLVGAPAPATVQSDLGAYPTPVGPQPRPGQAVLVASNGDDQLYATLNSQGGVCLLVSLPWQRPGANGEGGDCSANAPDSTPFWAGSGGMSPESDSGRTLVVYGHTTATGAASVRFDSPSGQSVSAPVGASGFFIADVTLAGDTCDWGAWTPSFDVLDSNGQQLSATSINILAGARKWTAPGRGAACGVTIGSPFGPEAGQLKPGP